MKNKFKMILTAILVMALSCTTAFAASVPSSESIPIKIISINSKHHTDAFCKSFVTFV